MAAPVRKHAARGFVSGPSVEPSGSQRAWRTEAAKRHRRGAFVSEKERVPSHRKWSAADQHLDVQVDAQPPITSAEPDFDVDAGYRA